jgi:hypothetical protein
VNPSRRQRHDPHPGHAHLFRLTRRVDGPRVSPFAFAQAPGLGIYSY